MEELIFKYGKYSHGYFLMRQNRETISLTVQPNLKIILKCPIKCSDEKIQKFLKRKWRWTAKQLDYFKKYKKEIKKREYVSGESFLYLGRQYKLLVQRARTDGVVLKHGTLVLSTSANNAKHNKKILEKWYFVKILRIFNEEYKNALSRFDYDFKPKLMVREMSKRWGSYLSGQKIILNPKLIQAPKECINYVITHELCHMAHKKHDDNFFKLLKSKINNWQEIKERLELRFL
jgi:hypothetical protein